MINISLVDIGVYSYSYGRICLISRDYAFMVSTFAKAVYTILILASLDDAQFVVLVAAKLRQALQTEILGAASRPKPSTSG